MENSVKSIVNKILVLLVVFAVIIGIYLFVNREKGDNKEIIMGNPVLPTVTLLSSQGEGQDNSLEVNELFGYTTQMETKYMRDCVTPISSGRTLTVKVCKYDNVIMGAEFEIRTLDNERLIEKTQVADENITEDEKYSYIRLDFDNMLESGIEYNLIIRITTDRNENVYFYTRIVEPLQNYCNAQIDFVKKFSNYTFDEEKSEEIIKYLEPDSSKDNTNLGHININSSYNQITWGNLKPEKVTEPVVKIKEILDDISCFEMVYKIKALNDYDTYQYYLVKEYFRIKWTSTEIYLLDYDRTMEQIFDATNQNVSSVRINIGISAEEDCEFLASDSTKYIAFVKIGGLWLMDIRKNQLKTLYAFQDIESSDIRDGNINDSIKIVSVDDSGNTEFIVYGYMNRGEHEGMVGVSLYSYDAEKNIVEEKIFIPFTRQYEILNETMGKLSYINSNNIMFIMLSDSVYSIDLTGSEYVEIISNLYDGMYSVNDDGNIIAWEEDGSKTGSKSIKILNLETGKEQEITANDGERLKVIGFVGEDFAYAIANENDVVYDISGNITTVMKELKIINMEGEVLKEYSRDGYYFVSAQIEDNMISLDRVTRAEDGINFVKADVYQIFGNEEEETNIVTLGVIKTELKQKELVINFVTKVTTSSKFKSVTPNEIRFSETNSLSIRELISDENNYYVYGKGKIIAITDKLSKAINLAYENAGVVIGESGEYVWAKISRPSAYSLSGINASAAIDDTLTSKLSVCINAMLSYNGINTDVYSQINEGKTAIEILNEKLSGKTTLDYTGCTLEEMLYYVSNGEPVLALADETNYVVITGYDFYNVVLFNPVTGENYKQGKEEAGEMFEKAGNKFIVSS